MLTSAVTVRPNPQQIQRFAGKPMAQPPQVQMEKPQPPEKPQELKDAEAKGTNPFEQENFFLIRWFKRLGRIIGIKMERGISKLEEGHEEELLEAEYSKILEKLAEQRVTVNKIGANYLKAKDQYEKMQLEFQQQQEEAMVAFRAMKRAEEKGDTEAVSNLKKMAIAQQKKAQGLEPRLAAMKERVETALAQKKAADVKWERLQEKKEQLRLQVDELKDKARMARLMKQERELDEELKALAGEDLALGSEFKQIAERINDKVFYEKAASSESLRTAEELLAQQAIEQYQEDAANENALSELMRKFEAESTTATEKKETVKTKTASAGSNGANSVADATE